MNNLIVGYGEIGKAVHGITGIAAIIDLTESLGEVERVEVMHICFPYSEDFVQSVIDYMNKFKPDHVVIYSTLPIGTTGLIGKAVHSPVEGKHPDLELSIRYMERWIGYNDKDEALFFNNYFQSLGLRTRLVKNTDCTEALKLLSTTEYGINIEFARYKAHVAESIDMDYELTKDFNREYNALYKNLGYEKEYQKFVLDAPDGPKGGHCVVPNALLLNDQFPNEMVRIVGEI